MNPKVSILVPIYNVSSFIDKCSISLFEQTFEDIEYVFVNDQTQDDSLIKLEKIIDKYPNRKSRVKIINHEFNKGLAAARNTAIENASGEYILHVDSDDYINTKIVELMYSKAIDDNSEIVVCNFLLEWNNVKTIAFQSIGINKVDFIQSMLSASTMVGLVNKLIKRSLYTVNGIKSIEGINLGEDFVTTPRLVYYAKGVSKVDLALYHYNQTNINSYSKNLNKKNIDDVIFVLEELTRFFEEKEDYDLYKNYLLQGKLRKKIELIFNSDPVYWNELTEVLQETNEINDFHFLNVREKIIYFFIKHNMLTGLNVYKSLYGIIFRTVQILKGRRN